jgi:hypothetical protein
MPRMRAVCPTVRKRRCGLSSCRAIFFFFMELFGFWRYRFDPFTGPDRCALMLPIFWIFQQAPAGYLNAGAKTEMLAILVVTSFLETSIAVADDAPERVFYSARILSRPQLGLCPDNQVLERASARSWSKTMILTRAMLTLRRSDCAAVPNSVSVCERISLQALTV